MAFSMVAILGGLGFLAALVLLVAVILSHR